MMARFTKVVFAAALVCALCLPAVAAQSATDLTGKHWLQSSQNEKLAFLYGASNIQKKLDAWYAAHPDQANREVFDVLWYEFMVPASK